MKRKKNIEVGAVHDEIKSRHFILMHEIFYGINLESGAIAESDNVNQRGKFINLTVWNF